MGGGGGYKFSSEHCFNNLFVDVNIHNFAEQETNYFISYFHFKLVLHENQKRNHFNIFLFIDIFYLLFILVSFVKLQPISLSQYFFLQNTWKCAVFNGDVKKWRIITTVGLA